jgi:hypothetical protein
VLADPGFAEAELVEQPQLREVVVDPGADRTLGRV